MPALGYGRERLSGKRFCRKPSRNQKRFDRQQNEPGRNEIARRRRNGFRRARKTSNR